MIYQVNEISQVHIEATTRCNATCPMCARNSFGKVAPGLKFSDLCLEDVQAIFPSEFLAHIMVIDICGAYGDPILAPDLVKIIKYFRSANSSTKITIYTNGGVKPTSWWRLLASSLGSLGRVVFAIDGLENTNSIYRKGVDFLRVINNAQSFIRAGGVAQWDFLVFHHNEHQIREARGLSKKLGFRQFSVKRTARFLKGAYEYVPELGKKINIKKFPIFNEEGMVVGALELPSKPSLVNDTVRNFTEGPLNHQTLNNLFSRTSICCQSKENRSVFVNALGYVFPCCWTYVQATTPIIYNFLPGVDQQMYNLVQKCGGFECINALNVGLDSAIQSSFFEAIKVSWEQSSIEEGRQKVCARVCGTEFPAYINQFQSPDLVPGNCTKLEASKNERFSTT